jgi:hypothetical protein
MHSFIFVLLLWYSSSVLCSSRRTFDEEKEKGRERERKTSERAFSSLFLSTDEEIELQNDVTSGWSKRERARATSRTDKQ